MWVISAVGLYILVSIFSRGTESGARWKILFIAGASSIIQTVISNAMPNLSHREPECWQLGRGPYTDIRTVIRWTSRARRRLNMWCETRHTLSAL
jgi:hypothetical protein